MSGVPLVSLRNSAKHEQNGSRTETMIHEHLSPCSGDPDQENPAHSPRP